MLVVQPTQIVIDVVMGYVVWFETSQVAAIVWWSVVDIIVYHVVGNVAKEATSK